MTMPSSTPGTLFLIAVPIGCVEDITLRALRLLREANLVIAEDARVTRKLLAHYAIPSEILSLTPRRATLPDVLSARFAAGGNFAFVTDAGTPGINDPGSNVVRLALSHSLHVTSVPGPSAVAAALSLAGFPSGPFRFVGSPPRTLSHRRSWFERLTNTTDTLVCFETPRALRNTLTDFAVQLGDDRLVACTRNLTRPDEFCFRGTLAQAVQHVGNWQASGQYTLVIASKRK